MTCHRLIYHTTNDGYKIAEDRGYCTVLAQLSAFLASDRSHQRRRRRHLFHPRLRQL